MSSLAVRAAHYNVFIHCCIIRLQYSSAFRQNQSVEEMSSARKHLYNHVYLAHSRPFIEFETLLHLLV